MEFLLERNVAVTIGEQVAAVVGRDAIGATLVVISRLRLRSNVIALSRGMQHVHNPLAH